MDFIWKDYSQEYEAGVEALFDSEAIRFTGCDDGFKAFYDYWNKEIGADAFWGKVIFLKGELIGVIALAKSPDGVFTLQELALSPAYRGKGCGTTILKALLTNSKKIIGQEITTAKAVIFPGNLASRKAFSKAGFVCVESHPDGDALYYEYHICSG